MKKNLNLEPSWYYPEIEPYRTGMLSVSEVHQLYFEECGNPNGKPVVYLHGGPGGGIGPMDRRHFNPDLYRIILFDQRGAGKSIPMASLVDNTTWHLVDDIEKLRNHLGIEKWQVFGGSWGSTLALCYAISHPSRVTELVLRGIFMLRQKELDWFYENTNGTSAIFPDQWQQYFEFIPPAERGNLIEAYHRRLTHPDSAVRLAAAQRWSAWEIATSRIYTPPELVEATVTDDFAIKFASIENHYFMNHGFFENENWILDHISKIRHIPAVIVQGRYDVVCPPMSAWELHQAWPESKLIFIHDAGHSAREPGIARALIHATDVFAHRR